LSFGQQPQVANRYFPVRVVEFSKALKPLMAATLTKRHQPLLAVGPLGVSLANDHGPNPKCPKHKKIAMTIPYTQLTSLHALVVHPMSPDPSNKQTKVVPKKQVQIIFND